MKLRYSITLLLLCIWAVLYGREWLEWTLNYNAVDLSKNEKKAAVVKPKKKVLTLCIPSFAAGTGYFSAASDCETDTP